MRWFIRFYAGYGILHYQGMDGGFDSYAEKRIEELIALELDEDDRKNRVVRLLEPDEFHRDEMVKPHLHLFMYRKGEALYWRQKEVAKLKRDVKKVGSCIERSMVYHWRLGDDPYYKTHHPLGDFVGDDLKAYFSGLSFVDQVFVLRENDRHALRRRYEEHLVNEALKKTREAWLKVAKRVISMEYTASLRSIQVSRLTI